jgi:hypothetical protein
MRSLDVDGDILALSGVGLPSFRRKEHGRHHSVVRNYALCREHADRRNLTIDVDGSASGMLWLAGGGAGMHSNHMNAYMRRSLDNPRHESNNGEHMDLRSNPRWWSDSHQYQRFTCVPFTHAKWTCAAAGSKTTSTSKTCSRRHSHSKMEILLWFRTTRRPDDVRR